MMQTMFNPGELRYGMSAPDSDEHPAGRPVNFEPVSWGECMFFLRLGYVIHSYRWDGKSFTSYQNFYPGDL